MASLLFCDETTVERSDKVNFFLYGGLVVPPEHFGSVCSIVKEARGNLDLKPTEPLKFASKFRPKHVTKKAWTEAKKDLLVGLGTLGLRFIGVYVHESVARGNKNEKVHWSIDAVCVMFNTLLESEKSQGFVVVDHTNDVERKDFAEIASGEVAVSIFKNELKAIGGVSIGHVEAALPLQAVDVVIGAIGYCLGHPEDDISERICEALAGLHIQLEQRPVNVRSERYSLDYKQLQNDHERLADRAKVRYWTRSSRHESP